jgi:hypothetical protein
MTNEAFYKDSPIMPNSMVLENDLAVWLENRVAAG